MDDRLADVEAIRQLKARYFRTMDLKDWAAYRGVFADDVVIDTSESGGAVWEGADTFVEQLRPILDGCVTVHQGHTAEIELTSSTTATGVWAMEDHLQWPNGMSLNGFGHYHDTYEKTGGQWFIKTSRLTRLRMDTTGPIEELTA